MKKKKIIVLIGIVVLIFIAVVTAICVFYLKNKHEYLYTFESGRVQDEVEWIGVAADGVSTCVVKYCDDFPSGAFPYRVIVGKYIIYKQMKGVVENYYKNDGSFLGEVHLYEKYEIWIYDLVSGEEWMLFDMKQYMEEHPDWQDSGSVRCYEIDGEYVIQVEMSPRPREELSFWDIAEHEYLRIRLKDGSYEISSEEIKLHMEPYVFCAHTFWEGKSLIEQNLPEGLYQELKDYAEISEYSNYAGVYEMITMGEYLPEQNEALYSMFPELENYRGEENCYIFLFIGNNPSFEQLLRLRMEDDQEISFEGLVLSDKYTIDGESHAIHSFEEFYEWLDR